MIIRDKIAYKDILDFSSYNSDNKLRQGKPKRTGLQFLLRLNPHLLLWTALFRRGYAQIES